MVLFSSPHPPRHAPCKDTERSQMSLAEAKAIMRECEVAPEHHDLLLRFLHSMGKVMT